MAKRLWEVTCTQIHNGTMTIEAESADEACAIAQERINECDFIFGEATADYAVESSNQ